MERDAILTASDRQGNFLETDKSSCKFLLLLLSRIVPLSASASFRRFHFPNNCVYVRKWLAAANLCLLCRSSGSSLATPLRIVQWMPSKSKHNSSRHGQHMTLLAHLAPNHCKQCFFSFYPDPFGDKEKATNMVNRVRISFHRPERCSSVVRWKVQICRLVLFFYVTRLVSMALISSQMSPFSPGRNHSPPGIE